MPIFKSLVWLDPEKPRRKRESNPGSSALEADALTPRPTRRSWGKYVNIDDSLIDIYRSVHSFQRGTSDKFLFPTLPFRSPCCDDQGPVSWRPTTVKWRQFSQSNRHSTIGTRQTEYHEALPSSPNDEVRGDCTFADDSNASWYSVRRVPMVEWRLDCENCRHLTVVGLHDTGPWSSHCELVRRASEHARPL